MDASDNELTHWEEIHLFEDLVDNLLQLCELDLVFNFYVAESQWGLRLVLLDASLVHLTYGRTLEKSMAQDTFYGRTKLFKFIPFSEV